MIFYCDNLDISSLSEISFPPGVSFVSAKNNNLVDLVGLPESVVELQVSNNPGLTTLVGIPPNLEKLVVNNCSLSSFENIGNLIVRIYADNNMITTLEHLVACNNLRYLSVDYNQITSLFGLPLNVGELHIEHNLLTSFQYCSYYIIHLYAKNNPGLIDLNDLNEACEKLEISGNNIVTFANLPSNVKHLYCEGIGSALNTVPSTIETVEIGRIKPQKEPVNIVSFQITNIEGSKFISPIWTPLALKLVFQNVNDITKHPIVIYSASLTSIPSADLRLVYKGKNKTVVVFETTITDPAEQTYTSKLSRLPPIGIIELTLEGKLSTLGDILLNYATVYTFSIQT